MIAVKVTPKLAQHKSTPSLRTVQEDAKENTEPVVLETDLGKEVFGKPDDSVFMKDDSLISSNRRDSLSSQLFSPLR